MDFSFCQCKTRQWMHVFINDRMSAHDFSCICLNVAASFGTETPLEWFTDTLIYSIEEAFF